MTDAYVERTERIGNLILQVVADTNGFTDSPYRENDQASEVFGVYRNLDLDEPPSEHLRILERGGLPLLYRYMRRFGDPRDGSKLLAIRQLACYDHSGITVWTEEIGSRRPHMFDSGGWDTSHIGYVMISKKRWDEVNGGDPDEEVDGEVKIGMGTIPVKMTNVYRVLELEVEEWDDWLRGNVWGYVITRPCDHTEEHYRPRDVSKTIDDDLIAACPRSKHVGSCWGYIGDPKYAYEDGKAEAEAMLATA